MLFPPRELLRELPRVGSLLPEEPPEHKGEGPRCPVVLQEHPCRRTGVLAVHGRRGALRGGALRGAVLRGAVLRGGALRGGAATHPARQRSRLGTRPLWSGAAQPDGTDALLSESYLSCLGVMRGNISHLTDRLS